MTIYLIKLKQNVSGEEWFYDHLYYRREYAAMDAVHLEREHDISALVVPFREVKPKKEVC